MRRGAITKLCADVRGATLIEFAIVAPVMCLFVVGAFDVAHTLYMKAVVDGIVQKTGRDSGLESGASLTQQALIEAKVTAMVRPLANNATVTFSRRYYRTFALALAARREEFTDTNLNGTCDPPAGLSPGEPYVDANNNGRWDADGADAGQGGAKDKTVYTVTVTYPRMFPLHGFIAGIGATQVIKVSTVLQNQPYSEQASYANTITLRNCP